MASVVEERTAAAKRILVNLEAAKEELEGLRAECEEVCAGLEEHFSSTERFRKYEELFESLQMAETEIDSAMAYVDQEF